MLREAPGGGGGVSEQQTTSAQPSPGPYEYRAQYTSIYDADGREIALINSNGELAAEQDGQTGRLLAASWEMRELLREIVAAQTTLWQIWAGNADQVPSLQEERIGKAVHKAMDLLETLDGAS